MVYVVKESLDIQIQYPIILPTPLPGYTYSIPPTRLIHVDIDPQEIGRNYPVAVGIVGDCKMVLRQLLAGIKGRAKDGWYPLSTLQVTR